MRGRPKLLSEKCSTCVFRPGNLMHLGPGWLQDLIQQNLRAGAALTCHQTLEYGENPDYGEAVCRGFYDAYGPAVNSIRVMERLGGFEQVEPPKKFEAEQAVKVE